MEEPTTPRKRSTSKGRRYVEVTPIAHRKLSDAADELGASNAAYTSAAVLYFAERGLNPITNQEREGITIQRRLKELEKLFLELSDRVVSQLAHQEQHLHETLVRPLRRLEQTLVTALQQQEKNVHEHLSDQEELFLMPMIRELFKVSFDAVYNRWQGTKTTLLLEGQNLSQHLKPMHVAAGQQRDQTVQKRLDEFVQTLKEELAAAAQSPPAPPAPARIATATTPSAPPAASGSHDYF